MVSMEMNAAEAKADYGMGEPQAADLPKYPYGLSITLDDATLKKLGMTAPAVGTVCSISAIAKVESVSSDDTEGGGAKSRVTLQITDMDAPTMAPTSSMSDRLYGGT